MIKSEISHQIEDNLSTDTLKAIEDYIQSDLDTSPIKIGRKKTHKPEHESKSNIISQPDNNLLFGLDDKNQPFCYIILQDSKTPIFSEILGTGTFGTIYNAVKATKKDNKLFFEPIAVKKLDFRSDFTRTANKSRAHSIKARNAEEEIKVERRATFRDNELLLGKAVGLIQSSIRTYDDKGLTKKIYIEMKKIEGETLYNALKHQEYPLPSIEEIIVNLLRELSNYHQHGFLHNDIKPENIMIAADLSTRFIDWGAGENARLGIQLPPGPKGTPGYLAFENSLLGQRSDKTDAFALGCVFLDLVTAHEAFVNYPEYNTTFFMNHTDLAKQKSRFLASETPQSLYDLVCERDPTHYIVLPPLLTNVLRALTMLNPTHRLTCREVLDLLPSDLLSKHTDKSTLVNLALSPSSNDIPTENAQTPNLSAHFSSSQKEKSPAISPMTETHAQNKRQGSPIVEQLRNLKIPRPIQSPKDSTCRNSMDHSDESSSKKPLRGNNN